MLSNVIQRRITDLLVDNGCISQRVKNTSPTSLQFEVLSADGSLRCFFRVKQEDTSLCVGVIPPTEHGRDLAEAHSAINIGKHLFSLKIPVPEIVAADKLSGLILFEDCGDIRLHDLIIEGKQKKAYRHAEILSYYTKVIKALAHMQVTASNGFQEEWCYDTPSYDRSIMITREAEYFIQAFWYSLLQGDVVEGINEEFDDIAKQAEGGLHKFFLHRDFQSRNIMIVKDEIRIIDFQGGRFGPPGYDLASLLIDPYSDLSAGMCDELLQIYLHELRKYCEYDEKAFLKQYCYLKLLRNLQIIGAFSFLYKKRGKIFFKDFIIPSLHQLALTLKDKEMRQYRQLKKMVKKAQSEISGII